MEEKERLIIDGNAVYEIDLECLRQKETGRRTDNGESRKARGCPDAWPPEGSGKSPGRKEQGCV